MLNPRQRFRLLVFSIIIMAWVCRVPPKDPLSFVEEYKTSKSHHEIGAALRLLAEDCVIEKMVLLRLEGKGKIREYLASSDLNL
jgi:hypothetical protein